MASSTLFRQLAHPYLCHVIRSGWLGKKLLSIDVAKQVSHDFELCCPVPEPFVCPALFEKYINSSTIAVVDEWTLSIAMGDNLAKEMEEHYSTFIVSSDISVSVDHTDLQVNRLRRTLPI